MKLSTLLNRKWFVNILCGSKKSEWTINKRVVRVLKWKWKCCDALSVSVSWVFRPIKSNGWKYDLLKRKRKKQFRFEITKFVQFLSHISFSIRNSVVAHNSRNKIRFETKFKFYSNRDSSTTTKITVISQKLNETDDDEVK